MLIVTEDNHLIYVHSGRAPVRPNVEAGTFIKDGTNSKNDWLGFMSVDDKMIVSDPKSGFFVTSNNKVASTKYHGGYFNNRPKHIN